MSYRHLLNQLMVTPVPSFIEIEGTEKMQMGAECSLGYLGSTREIDIDYESRFCVINSVCKCGYRPPFCGCNYRNLSNDKGRCDG